ncbi:hypothetical protein DFJ73DRAFT_861761 [Zopfochytrium polystomum]|nr:hypothetical protein DFJ73DRAFT_861761 [Zopfochytrium polystomum]
MIQTVELDGRLDIRKCRREAHKAHEVHCPDDPHPVLVHRLKLYKLQPPHAHDDRRRHGADKDLPPAAVDDVPRRDVEDDDADVARQPEQELDHVGEREVVALEEKELEGAVHTEARGTKEEALQHHVSREIHNSVECHVRKTAGSNQRLDRG